MEITFLNWTFEIDTGINRSTSKVQKRCTCPECTRIYTAIEHEDLIPYLLKEFIIKSGLSILDICHQSGTFTNPESTKMAFIFEYQISGTILNGIQSKRTDPKSRKGQPSYILDFHRLDEQMEIAVYNEFEVPSVQSKPLIIIQCRGQF